MRQQPSAALAEILASDQKAGVDVFDHGPVAPMALGAPVQLPPLERPVFETPNWRAEEEAAARRNAEPEPDPEPPPPESLESRPAKRRRKPAGTPNLDQIRKWRDGR